MATVINTLYPPAVSSQMPAFIYDKEATVYFSVSSYDDTDDIAYVHVSVVDQRTNKNVLIGSSGVDQKYYPSIIPYTFSQSTYLSVTKVSGNLYKILIPATAIQNGSFNPNQFYKVQIRFQLKSEKTATNADNPCTIYQPGQTGGSAQELNRLLNEYRPYFSEWSTVCLIRPIYNPEIFYSEGEMGLSKFNLDNGNAPSFTPGEVRISGFLDFYENKNADGDYKLANKSSEKLKSYTISVVKNSGVNEETRTSELEDDNVYIEGETYYPSGVNTNEINTTINIKEIQDLEITSAYIKIDIVTTNNYKFSRYFIFRLNKTATDTPWKFDYDNIKTDNESGTIALSLSYSPPDGEGENYSEWYYGKLHVCRTSSISNFTKWEEIALYDLQLKNKDNRKSFVLIDNSVGSLIGYKYSMQFENSKGLFYKTIETNKIFMLDFYGALFSRDNKILKVTFDFNASQLTPTVNRAVFNTLGSKYPKFAENAIINYKKYSISGKISSQDDDGTIYTYYDELSNGLGENVDYSKLLDGSENKTYTSETGENNELIQKKHSYIESFISKKETIGEEFFDYYYKNSEKKLHGGKKNYELWDNWLKYNDYMWEREYREAVIKWLNDGEPKLFRTMTEGNLVVILSDISLTPTQGLSRRLWDFSATMYEIEDGNDINILDEYGIYNILDETAIDINNADEIVNEDEGKISTESSIGQLPEFSITNYIENGKALGSKVCQYLKDYKTSMLVGVKGKNTIAEKDGNVYLQDVKIQFLNKPHIFITTEDGVKIASTINNNNYEDSYYGYYLEVIFFNEASIDNPFTEPQGFWVNDKGYIQFPSELKIAEITFPYMIDENEDGSKDTVSIDYTVHFKLLSDTSEIVGSEYVFDTIIGQEYGVYSSGTSIGTNLYKKYTYVEYSSGINQKINSVRKLTNWTGISLETEPYSIITIKYSDNDETDYLIGETGILSFNEGIKVSDIITVGRRMILADDPRFMREHEFYMNSTSKTNHTSIKDISPKNHWVYKINENYMIYHNGNFYKFEQDKTNDNIGIAKIPLNIILNYTGYITKEVYGNE